MHGIVGFRKRYSSRLEWFASRCEDEFGLALMVWFVWVETPGLVVVTYEFTEPGNVLAAGKVLNYRDI